MGTKSEQCVGNIQQLDQEFTSEHADELLTLVRQIPEVHYTAEDLIAVAKPDGRQMYAKWRHSYALLGEGAICGFVMAYERAAEGNGNYPTDSIYISELAVARRWQGRGFGGRLLRQVLQQGLDEGFTVLSGPVEFSLQTNSAGNNDAVRKLYERFGFIVTGAKQYSNRTDVVMHADSTTVRARLEAWDENHRNQAAS